MPGKSDQIHAQQNNTIIVLLTSLHYRLTVLENRLLSTEQQVQGANGSIDWKEALENINKDLSKLSTGNIVARQQPKTYSFLTYNPDLSKWVLRELGQNYLLALLEHWEDREMKQLLVNCWSSWFPNIIVLYPGEVLTFLNLSIF